MDHFKKIFTLLMLEGRSLKISPEYDGKIRLTLMDPALNRKGEVEIKPKSLEQFKTDFDTEIIRVIQQLDYKLTLESR